MKLLLTGLPKSGKSTMLVSIIANVSPRRGLFSPEVRENDERIGFDLQDELGNVAILSRIGTITNYPVGRYYVNLASFGVFIEPLFKYSTDSLLFIDEIGQMQLYSERFKALVKDYVGAPNDFFGTISQVYDHPFIRDLKQNKDILLCTVKPENRVTLKVALIEALNHRATFNLLSRGMQHEALNLARGYVENDQYISLKKLFKNAISYICENKIQEKGNKFVVQGNASKHQVRVNHGDFVCDCDFFNGSGQFADKAGECSHIQSAKLFRA
jgi:nucleoside-triphosphatase